MKTLVSLLVLCLSFCWPCAGQQVAKPETIEMQVVLFSNCLKSQQVGPEDLWPVRLVHVNIQALSSKVIVRCRESDEACHYSLAKSFEWTVAKFENAKMRLKKAGLHGTIMPAESSGNNFPLSFLKVQSPSLSGEIYTMYLRFRWAGKLSTPDAEAAAILEEWQSVLQDATQQVDGFKL